MIKLPFLHESFLENYYKSLSAHLSTGVDRITPDKFESEKDFHFSVIKRKVEKGTYSFTRLKSSLLPTGREVFIPTIRDRIVVEILKDNVRRKYRIKHVNRAEIIDEIINKLGFDMPYFIIRLDIKDFFSSIPHGSLLHKLRESSILNFQEYTLIKQILRIQPKGVPQGLSISNVLSEIYLEEMDQSLKLMHPRINTYFRYVDDIIILINGSLLQSEEMKLRDAISNIFQQHKLEINQTKAQFINFNRKNSNQQPIEFLGYKFGVSNRRLHLSITDKKIDNIKEKIDSIFRKFDSLKNDEMLVEQLKYLIYKKAMFKKTSKVLRDGSTIYLNRKIYFGVTESYKRVPVQDAAWENLDKYIRIRIQARKKSGTLTRKTLRKLYAFSFESSISNECIFKMHKLSRLDLIKTIQRLDPTLSVVQLKSENRTKLFMRYFKIVNVK